MKPILKATQITIVSNCWGADASAKKHVCPWVLVFLSLPTSYAWLFPIPVSDLFRGNYRYHSKIKI